MTYLAVSIYGKDVSEFESRINSSAQAGAEIIELRTDYLSLLNQESVRSVVSLGKSTGLPLIVTCRDKKEGGVGQWNQTQRTEVLLTAIEAGSDYIDCEFANFKETVRKRLTDALTKSSKTKLILSSHNFEGPFENPSLLLESILTAYPDAIPKIVFTAGHINDCFAAFDVLHESSQKGIIFAMGQSGIISRILAKKFGAFLTFAALDEGWQTAPGQLTIQAFRQLFRWDTMNSKTEIFGIIGDPVAHSLSPAAHNACYVQQNMDALFLPLLVHDHREGFNVFIENVLKRPWMNFGGFSVTMPHKTHALDFATAKGEFVENLAALIGSANTIKIGFNNLITAHNTDYAGAMDALTVTLGIGKHQLHSRKVAVIGAGGVSRAVVAGLIDAGADVTIYNRTVNKAQSLAAEFRCHAAGLERLEELESDIIVNCTSIGMSPDIYSSPVPAKIFKPGMTAFDTVYSPLRTRFLQEAEAAGCTIVNGAEMFIRQAMAQFKIFTGRDADENTIRQAVMARLTVK